MAGRVREKKFTEQEWRDIDLLRQYWSAFCDADPVSHDFSERMEAAGFIKLRAVTQDDLERSFASELGIEKGGNLWDLTPAGRAALAREEG